MAPKFDFQKEVLSVRIGCAYKAASCRKQHFAPNSVGSVAHTTCPKGAAKLAELERWQIENNPLLTQSQRTARKANLKARIARANKKARKAA